MHVLQTRLVGYRLSCAAAVLAVVLSACTTTGTRGDDKDTPYLSDLYSPSASPKIEPGKRLKPVPRKPAHRRQIVRSPDGKRYVLRWTKTTESIGRPNDGRLSGSSRLPRRGVGYVRIGQHAHATDETIAYVEYASWVVSRMFPNSPPVAIGDLSGDGGGRLSPHLSHRSGRDVDLGYFRNDNRPMHRFEKMSPNEIDVSKTWIMLEALLSTGAVQYIFVDRAFQKKMFTYALSAGWPEETLLPVFQHPGGRSGTIIRHRGGHNNHFHIRFKCSPDDRACIP